MEAKEFIEKLNAFIVVYSRPQEIISDNAKTFKAAAKFIEKLSAACISIQARYQVEFYSRQKSLERNVLREA